MSGGYNFITSVQIEPVDDSCHALGRVVGDDHLILINAERPGDALSMLGIHAGWIYVHQAAAPLAGHLIDSVEHRMRHRTDGPGVEVYRVLRQHEELADALPARGLEPPPLRFPAPGRR